MDNLAKKQLLASKLSTEAGRLMTIVRDLRALRDEYYANGITFTDADFTTEVPAGIPLRELAHLDAATITAVITSAEALVGKFDRSDDGWMLDNGHETNFSKATK